MVLTNRAAVIALAKRQLTQSKPIELDPRFGPQNALINDPSRFIVAQCSRRAGKTNGIAIRFFKTLEKYPKSQCLYLSLTRESAKEILWPVLQEINDKFKLGCTFIESSLIMKHPNGSKLILFGADMKNFIKRLKGRKHPGIAVDEAQDFGTHLQSLVDDVLTPSISDYSDGWLLLTGTPGPVPQGYFFDITQNRRFGYSVHSWTILENPYMPDPAGFIADLKSKREWDDGHPTLLREWRNRWVLDVESLWVKYKENINDYDVLPSLSPGQKYTYIMGVDIGFKDADAIAIIAWHESTSTVYLVEEVITKGSDLTDLTNQINELNLKYDVSKMVIDEGGLGKKMAEELRRRKGIPVQAADKSRKQENVAFLNEYLRLGKFKAKANSQFAQDSYLIQIDWEKSTPDKIVIKKKPHSDIIDAVLYSFKESPAYAYIAPIKGPEYGSIAWAEAQEKDMFEAELEGLTKEWENQNPLDFDD